MRENTQEGGVILRFPTGERITPEDEELLTAPDTISSLASEQGEAAHDRFSGAWRQALEQMGIFLS